MTFVYIVRCNFTQPAREQAWNDWYSGPKIQQMLRLPYFLSCQRFRRAAGAGRDYLALWTMERAEAMSTPEYLSQWGFSTWSPFITDWSRDLFDARPAPQTAFAVAPGGALGVISFDGMGADAARAASASLEQSNPAMMWLPIAGLDRHTPMIGLRPLSTLEQLAGREAPPAGVQQAIYRPISAFHTAPRSAA
jgi:hypothetical protein